MGALAVLIGGAVLVATAVLVAIAGIPITGLVGDRLVRLVEERFASDLEFSSLKVTLIPLTARIEKVVFRHKGRRDVPPLLRLDRGTAQFGVISLLSLWSRAPRVNRVTLEGLDIVVARRRSRVEDEEEDRGDPPPGFVVEQLVADGAVLRILPKDDWKEPLRFNLKSLRMESVALVRPMRFVAELTNPKPPGLIQTEGEFGPWNQEDPGLTPVRGDYVFENADLGHFDGIGGILSSTGRFHGPLERLIVDGVTDTPDFHVDVSGQRVHLKTEFHAIVDGTDGDTLLQPVKATFENSTIVCHGGVYGIKGVKGKTVKLDVDVDRGRIEDMMKFAVKTRQPILRGPIRYEAKLEIPPGKAKVVRKLKLDGVFRVSDGRFTNKEVRQKLGSLSNKAQGQPEAPPPADTASDFSGRFLLDAGVLSLPDLFFRVPGATVRLHGSYHLLSEEIDFTGVLRMDAKVSETTTGIKSLLLKIADPLFRGKNGAKAEVPIRIKGRRSDPKFGLDVGEVVKP